ncbi:SMI1/KNR4 family protein [Paenibacillus mesotrionivorans]|uniref:SMI1/KNR4 family protein n=1 Tax=Paenibacillus mesotrionivorans TaxID=3160968 RepID=A0ACC7NY62_9BACL
MKQSQLSTFIQEHVEDDDFTGGVSDTIIAQTEDKLKVVFPPSYTWFLKHYGSGGIFGVDILGCGKSAVPSVVSNTERLRNIGLPSNYIVIENCDEFFYCLYTGDRIEKECPVVVWDRNGGASEKRADDFYSFLLERLMDAKENWEE